jgi:ATP-dependent Lon protease
VKNKVLAAVRAGITTVMLPERNRKDYEDIPESAREAVRFVWMSTVDDAMAAALSSPEVHVQGPNELSDVQRRLASG